MSGVSEPVTGLWIAESTHEIVAVTNAVGPASTVSVYLDNERHVVTCVQQTILPPGLPSDVVFGWASVLVGATVLWAYVVTRPKKRKATP